MYNQFLVILDFSIRQLTVITISAMITSWFIYLSLCLSITRTNQPLYCAISSLRLDMYANQIKSTQILPNHMHARIHHFARSNQIKSNHAKRVKTHSNRLSNEINTRSEAEVPNTWSTIPEVLTMRAQGGNELSPGVGLHAAFRACENVTNRIKEWSITISLHPPTDDDELMLNVLRCHETY